MSPSQCNVEAEDHRAVRRAYDMAAIALKGMDKATTNFPKERYVHEPFLQVRCV